MLLAIDPGADSGWALFENSTLRKAGLGAPALIKNAPLEKVVVERPMIYPGGRQKARPRDVITLALKAGEVAGAWRSATGCDITYHEPDEWKGGAISKDMHQPRIWAALRDEEQEILSQACKGKAAGKRHNIIDAVGIGLYAVGRQA